MIDSKLRTRKLSEDNNDDDDDNREHKMNLLRSGTKTIGRGPQQQMAAEPVLAAAATTTVTPPPRRADLKSVYESVVECTVCMEEHEGKDMVYMNGCTHLFCKSCVTRAWPQWRCMDCRGNVSDFYSIVKCGERYRVKSHTMYYNFIEDRTMSVTEWLNHETSKDKTSSCQNDDNTLLERVKARVIAHTVDSNNRIIKVAIIRPKNNASETSCTRSSESSSDDCCNSVVATAATPPRADLQSVYESEVECTVCMTEREGKDMVYMNNCTHSFCKSCVTRAWPQWMCMECRENVSNFYTIVKCGERYRVKRHTIYYNFNEDRLMGLAEWVHQEETSIVKDILMGLVGDTNRDNTVIISNVGANATASNADLFRRLNNRMVGHSIDGFRRDNDVITVTVIRPNNVSSSTIASTLESVFDEKTLYDHYYRNIWSNITTIISCPGLSTAV